MSAERVRQAIHRTAYADVEVLDDAVALETIGIDLNAVKAKLEEAFGPGVLDEPPPPRKGWFGRRRTAQGQGVGRRPFTKRCKVVLELSPREALALKHKHIGTEHIPLGLIREGNGLATKILADEGADLKRLRDRTIEAARKG